MRSCKNCIHYEVCVKIRKPALYGIDENVGCEQHFKDKSKFIEKPFDVRDTVYIITKCSYSSPYEIIKCLVTKMRIKDCGTITFSCEGHYQNNWRYTSGNFKTSSIGKTVFLTLEEAQKKLEELNG